MPVERRIDIRNFKRVALAAPVLLFAAHFGCSSHNKKEPTTPSQTSGQQVNPVTTPTPFTEQFGNSIQPTEPITKPATRVPTVSTPETQTRPTIDSNGNLIINESGYSYTIYKGITLNKLVTFDLEGYIGPFISLQVSNDIHSLLKAAQQKEQVNSQDPAIIKSVNSAANLLNAHCNNNVYARSIMGYLASYLYLEKPQDWQNNKRIYLDGACFWGEKN